MLDSVVEESLRLGLTGKRSVVRDRSKTSKQSKVQMSVTGGDRTLEVLSSLVPTTRVV